MEEQNLRFQEEAKQYVRSIGRWNRFFAILSIISCVFMVLGAMVMFATGSMMEGMMSNMAHDEYAAAAGMAALPTALIAVLYLVIAGLQVPIIIYLMRSAKAAETAVALNSNEAAVSFLANSKSYWKYYGILTIVMLAFCIVVLPIIVIGSVAAAL